MTAPPSYDSRGLVNLVSEIETRFGGSPPAPGLATDVSGDIPDGSTYVVVLFDGLGIAQLAHPGAARFTSSLAGSLEAGFPTTTSTSLATRQEATSKLNGGSLLDLSCFQTPPGNKVHRALHWNVNHARAFIYPPIRGDGLPLFSSQQSQVFRVADL
jgi:hypothetical protein